MNEDRNAMCSCNLRPTFRHWPPRQQASTTLTLRFALAGYLLKPRANVIVMHKGRANAECWIFAILTREFPLRYGSRSIPAANVSCSAECRGPDEPQRRHLQSGHDKTTHASSVKPPRSGKTFRNSARLGQDVEYRSDSFKQTRFICNLPASSSSMQRAYFDAARRQTSLGS